MAIGDDPEIQALLAKLAKENFSLSVTRSESKSVKEYVEASAKGLCLPPNWQTAAVREILNLEDHLRRTRASLHSAEQRNESVQ